MSLFTADSFKLAHKQEWEEDFTHIYVYVFAPENKDKVDIQLLPAVQIKREVGLAPFNENYENIAVAFLNCDNEQKMEVFIDFWRLVEKLIDQDWQGFPVNFGEDLEFNPQEKQGNGPKRLKTSGDIAHEILHEGDYIYE